MKDDSSSLLGSLIAEEDARVLALLNLLAATPRLMYSEDYGEIQHMNHQQLSERWLLEEWGLQPGELVVGVSGDDVGQTFLYEGCNKNGLAELTVPRPHGWSKRRTVDKFLKEYAPR